MIGANKRSANFFMIVGVKQPVCPVCRIDFIGLSNLFGCPGVETPEKRTADSITLPNITPYGVMLKMDNLSNVLTAISHPSRRAILGQLAKGPARFLDVAQPLDVSLNAVTKHLKLLERAGLISRKKMGREVMISAEPKPLRLVAGWVHEYETMWNEKLDLFENHFKTKRSKKS